MKLKSAILTCALSAIFISPITTAQDATIERLVKTEELDYASLKNLNFSDYANQNVPPGTTFSIAEGVNKVAFSELTLGKNSTLKLPKDASKIEVVINKGTFHSGAKIVGQRPDASDGKGYAGPDGTDITIFVHNANFILDNSVTSGGKDKFTIQSTGGVGGDGGRGKKGNNAKRKRCSGSDGHPAGNGGIGQRGGAGGNGGSILFNVRLASNHPVITNRDIALNSVGGRGGNGGPGGAGGAGAPGKKCSLGFKRGGYGAGKSGPKGSKGANGKSERVKLNLDF